MRGVSDPLDLSVGLEQILRQEPGQAAVRLPETTIELFPADEQPIVHLEKLLRANSIESGILQALKPALPNKEIFSPSRFNALLDEAASSLQGLPAADSDPDLREALALLQADRENKDLLNLYRSLLHKG